MSEPLRCARPLRGPPYGKLPLPRRLPATSVFAVPVRPAREKAR